MESLTPRGIRSLSYVYFSVTLGLTTRRDSTQLNPTGSWVELSWVESRRTDMLWGYDDVRLPTTVDDGQSAPVGDSKHV